LRIYLEINEVIEEGEEAEFIRSDVTEMTAPEIDAVKVAMQDIMKEKNYSMVLHTCGHDEDKACTMEAL